MRVSLTQICTTIAILSRPSLAPLSLSLFDVVFLSTGADGFPLCAPPARVPCGDDSAVAASFFLHRFLAEGAKRWLVSFPSVFVMGFVDGMFRFASFGFMPGVMGSPTGASLFCSQIFCFSMKI